MAAVWEYAYLSIVWAIGTHLVYVIVFYCQKFTLFRFYLCLSAGFDQSLINYVFFVPFHPYCMHASIPQIFINLTKISVLIERSLLFMRKNSAVFDYIPLTFHEY